MSKFLVWEQDGGVLTLTMNRPEERNALSYGDQFEDFVEATEKINADMSIRAVILTGAGSAFCAGGNVKQMKSGEGIFAGTPFQQRNGYKHGIQLIPHAWYNLEVPTIAAVNGPAIGAGCDLACMCDIRIGSTNARFAESFVKLGIIPGDGGAYFLPRAVGWSKAMEMSFTGDPVGGEEALQCGLISKLTSPEDLLKEAKALAQRIAVNPPHALRLTKRLLREAAHAKLDTILELSAAYQALAHHTADHKEAVAAFFDKRKPDFKGA
jgi:enoyl-CoA hydratase/carnithine racemase